MSRTIYSDKSYGTLFHKKVHTKLCKLNEFWISPNTPCCKPDSLPIQFEQVFVKLTVYYGSFPLDVEDTQDIEEEKGKEGKLGSLTPAVKGYSPGRKR
jgi:hypothetical protein